MTLPIVAATAQRIRAGVPAVETYEDEAPDRVEGTGTAVIEIRYRHPWGPALHNARHSVIQVNILSDTSRDDFGNPIGDDADSRAWAIWESVDKLLNDVGHEWPAVHTSRRSDGPVLTLIPDGDGSVMLSARYELSHD